MSVAVPDVEDIKEVVSSTEDRIADSQRDIERLKASLVPARVQIAISRHLSQQSWALLAKLAGGGDTASPSREP